jgi:small subunit ribosomal protein S17
MAKGSFGGRKVREGTVVSDKMDKTVVVAVETRVRHRLYKKIVRRLRHHLAHDETNDAKLGDTVRIVESRPYSRRKRWRLAEVLIRAERPEVAAADVDLELLGEVKSEKEEEEPAALVEAVAEEATPEGETEVPAEAAEEVPPVEEVAAEPEVAEAEEAPVAGEPEAEADVQAEKAPEIAAEAAEGATPEEAEEAAARESEGEGDVQAEKAPEVAAEAAEGATPEEAEEAAAQEPEGEGEGEDKEGSA